MSESGDDSLPRVRKIDGASFWGEPIMEMDRERLLDVIESLAERIDEMQSSSLDMVMMGTKATGSWPPPHGR
ncbi:hypothetical protein [Rhodobium gokarnense]|uniref:Uncharacterized protein n=1 Tax=Rhodobium gokarnense TaxID=364296 RepID=A0ABT3HH51_9HYPH|nr:hypothetical protein [Rhodobium gokarnense]MCW2309713.1 hypothetical protein [Rhodobium gokarnense]